MYDVCNTVLPLGEKKLAFYYQSVGCPKHLNIAHISYEDELFHLDP